MKEIKLYNVIFPLWMLLLFPQVWLIVLPGNFIIDSIVFCLSLAFLKIADKKKWYKSYILKIYGVGLLSDVIGALCMLVPMLAFEAGRMGDELYLTLPALFVSALMIFILNYCYTFKSIDKALRLRLSLTFAIVTAPYTFLVPTSWLY